VYLFSFKSKSIKASNATVLLFKYLVSSRVKLTLASVSVSNSETVSVKIALPLWFNSESCKSIFEASSIYSKALL